MANITDETAELARCIWDYMRLNHTLAPSDLILTLGSNDLRVAAHAADCYLRGLAPLLMFSGNVGALTRGVFAQPEAELFAAVAVQKGVPRDAILCETASTNTGDNLRFSRRLLEHLGHRTDAVLLVTKPQMLRRALATAAVVWTGVSAIASCPLHSFEEQRPQVTHSTTSSTKWSAICSGSWNTRALATKRRRRSPKQCAPHTPSLSPAVTPSTSSLCHPRCRLSLA